MKRLFVLFSICIPYLSQAQVSGDDLQYNSALGYNYRNLFARERVFLPKDTLSTADSGALAFINPVLYIKTGIRWVEWGFKKVDDSTYVSNGDTLTITGGTGTPIDILSLSARIDLKLNISDTTNMLVPYLRKADTTEMLLPYLRKIDTTLFARKPVSGDLSGNLPAPRLAHTVIGTGDKLQIKNNVVVGDTLVRLGQIFNDNFARSSLGSNYGTAGSQTVSFPSSAYMQIVGGLDYDNNVYRVDYTGVNRWIDSVKYTTGTPGGATYGLVINFYDPVNYSTGIRVQFGAASGGLTNIYFRHYNGTQLAASTSPQTITAGDTLLAIVERFDNSFFCTYKNLTTGAVATTLTYTYSTLTSAAMPSPASGRMAIGSLGGTQNIAYWSHASNEVKTQSAVVGNSIASGGYTATVIGKSWPDLVFSSRDQWARLGGSGDRSSDVINYIPQVRTLSPRVIYYCLGVNDALNSVPGATYSSNVQRFYDSCIAIGATVISLELPPNNTVLTKPYSDTLAAIAARYGFVHISGIYDALRTGTAFAAAYSTDGIHPTDAGHKIISEYVTPVATLASYKLVLLGIPSDSTGTERMLVRSDNGNVKTNIKANEIQRIGETDRVGDQMLLPSSLIPTRSAKMSSPNGFIEVIQNSSTSGWTGRLYNNQSGVLVYAEGWQNSGTTSGNGAIPDSGWMAKTYNRSTGYFAWYAGDNQTTNAYSDFIIKRGSILPGRHVAAGRTVNPISGMFYYDTDSSEFVIYTGSVWVRYSRIGVPGFVNPMTTAGDLITGGASGVATRLALGPLGYLLRSNGSAVEYINPAVILPSHGSWSPTSFSITNVASSTIHTGQYTNTGGKVVASISINVDPTSTGLVEIDLTPPTSTSFADVHACSGTANGLGIAGVAVANSTDGRIRISFISPDGSDINMRIILMYTETAL